MNDADDIFLSAPATGYKKTIEQIWNACKYAANPRSSQPDFTYGA